MNKSLKNLYNLTAYLEKNEDEIIVNEKIIENIANNINIAIWAKDIYNDFIYANKTCCDLMLHCSEEEIINFTDKDFSNQDLSWACHISDELVKGSLNSKYFIEHDKLWWRTKKSPLFKGKKLIGTIGIARNITNIIPEEIKLKYKNKFKIIEIDKDFEISYLNINLFFNELNF